MLLSIVLCSVLDIVIINIWGRQYNHQTEGKFQDVIFEAHYNDKQERLISCQHLVLMNLMQVVKHNL